jgi:hypothetical protein
MDTRKARIAKLNDMVRWTLQGGRVLITPGIQSEGEEFVASVLAAVRSFDNFHRDNDPHGEHDFGSLSVEGIQIFFKFDYYNPSLDGGSKDPADPTKTTRVLTIMLPEEY